MALVGPVIKDTFGFFARNKQVAALGAIGWAAAAVATLAVTSILLPSGATWPPAGYDPKVIDTTTLMANMGRLIAAGAVSAVLSLIINAYFRAATYRFIKGRDMRAALGEGFAYMPSLIAAWILSVILISVVISGPVMLAAIVSTLLGPLGVILIILAVVYAVAAVVWLSVKLAFMEVLICIGKRGPIQAIKESKAHSDGYFWSVLLTTFAFGMMIGIMMIPVYILYFALGTAGQYIGGFVGGLISPLSQIMLLMLFFDIKRRRENRPQTVVFETSPKVKYTGGLPGQKLG
jgi:hypothetical protein